MEKDLNINNSKKLIIGVSILFCTIILIIGATTAYFTQSDSEDTGNIVATDKVTLDYQDNVDYMRSDLIPINEEDLGKAYNKTGDEKCKDDKGYNVCSIYQFTITNNSDVSQSLIIDLIPKANSFHNLKFNLKDITNNKEIMNNVKLIYLSEVEINLLKNITLNNNSNNTYELTFYIENKSDEDQSILDSGKRFGANIRVNSVTTGNYILKGFGEECWTATDNNTKLTEFHGLDENGNVKEECSGYIKKDTDNLYIVNIPSKYAGSDVTTLGNTLFHGGLKKIYKNIKEIKIGNGISNIEGYAFYYLGNLDINNYLKISFPETLVSLEAESFRESAIMDLKFPSNLKIIERDSFRNCYFSFTDNSSLTIPASVISIGNAAFKESVSINKLIFEDTSEKPSQLESIGAEAFWKVGLSYTEISNPLVIPASVNVISLLAFDGNPNLNYIQYKGTNSEILNNTTNWYNPSVTELNPQ